MKMQTVLTSHQNIFNLIQGSRQQLGLGTNNFTNTTNLLQNLIFFFKYVYVYIYGQFHFEASRSR